MPDKVARYTIPNRDWEALYTIYDEMGPSRSIDKALAKSGLDIKKSTVRTHAARYKWRSQAKTHDESGGELSPMTIASEKRACKIADQPGMLGDIPAAFMEYHEDVDQAQFDFACTYWDANGNASKAMIITKTTKRHYMAWLRNAHFRELLDITRQAKNDLMSEKIFVDGLRGKDSAQRLYQMAHNPDYAFLNPRQATGAVPLPLAQPPNEQPKVIDVARSDEIHRIVREATDGPQTAESNDSGNHTAPD